MKERKRTFRITMVELLENGDRGAMWSRYTASYDPETEVIHVEPMKSEVEFEERHPWETILFTAIGLGPAMGGYDEPNRHDKGRIN